MWGWKPYVPVAQRAANAAKAIAKMVKKGAMVLPVKLTGRKIASTFWGKGWCDHLEGYSDYSNRLPRGRTYVRNGSVVDLQIDKGKITALVSGSELYKIEIKIKPLPSTLWTAVQTECAGKIDSLIELLQGRLSSGVMQVVTHREKGLFPKPAEIDMDCSCPDWAGMCKHLAAVLYGVGARLDEKPELIFLLRGVDPSELISKITAAQAVEQVATPNRSAMGDAELADVFGIELDTGSNQTVSPAPAPATNPVQRSPKKAARPVAKKASSKSRKKKVWKTENPF